MSSGEKQRVVLARAVVRQPSVLVLDEALSSLDAAETVGIFQRLVELGATLFTVSRLAEVKRFHRRELALDVCYPFFDLPDVHSSRVGGS